VTGNPISVQQSNKATEDPQDDEDDGATLSGLQEVDDDEEVEPDFDGGNGDDADKLNNAVEASDQAMVDKVT